MTTGARKPSRPVKISAIANALGVSGQTVRNWVTKLGITPCATPRVPEVIPDWRAKNSGRTVWALMPDDAEKLMRAYRSR